MKTGMGLALIAIGAIFAFAVTTNTSVFNLHTAGWVLMIIGVIGIAIPRRGYGWVGRRLFVRQARWRPGNRVDEVTYPPAYVSHSPADTRVQASLPAPGAPGSPEAARVEAAHAEAARAEDARAEAARAEAARVEASHDPGAQDLSAEPRPGETQIIQDVYED